MIIAAHCEDIKTFRQVCKCFDSAARHKGLWKYKAALIAIKLNEPLPKDDPPYLTYLALKEKRDARNSQLIVEELEKKRQQLALQVEVINQQLSQLKVDKSRINRERQQRSTDNLRNKMFYAGWKIWKWHRLPQVHKVNPNYLLELLSGDRSIPSNMQEFDIVAPNMCIWPYNTLFIYRTAKGTLSCSTMGGDAYGALYIPVEGYDLVQKVVQRRLQYETLYDTKLNPYTTANGYTLPNGTRRAW